MPVAQNLLPKRSIALRMEQWHTEGWRWQPYGRVGDSRIRIFPTKTVEFPTYPVLRVCNKTYFERNYL